MSVLRRWLIVAGAGVICLAGIAVLVVWRAKSDDAPAATQPAKGLTAPAQTVNDLAYAGTSPAQKLDLYLPARTGTTIPVVLVIHGGAFSSGDKHDEPGIVGALNQAGYAAASINYRLSGEAPFPAAVQDAKASVRWLRANSAKYGLDPGKIGAWGTSAGGNLAAMVGVTGTTHGFLDDADLGNADQSSAVSAVIDWYGPSDFLTMDAQAQDPGGCPGQSQLHDPPDSPESVYLRAPIQTIPDQVAAASPINYLSGNRSRPSFFLVAGSADCTVPHGQSQQFADALKQANVPVSLTIVDGAGHADPVIAQAQTGPALDFLHGIFGR
jgi:acetyl esterase/lipase